MFYADIEKKFTEKVAEYMAKGLVLNTTTMMPPQGEIAKVDFKANDGKIIRVMMENGFEKGLKTLKLTVTTGTTDYGTYCNDYRKEVIYSEKWYQNSDNNNEWD